MTPPVGSLKLRVRVNDGTKYYSPEILLNEQDWAANF